MSKDTGMVDELSEGKWPSFVNEIKKMADTKPMARDLLRQLDKSYNEKKTHWKHGGIVGIKGYGGGIIGRYSDSPDEFPGVAHFHSVRVNQPSGWFYTSAALNDLCDIFDKHGSGLTNMHGSTGDAVLLGTTTDELEPIFSALTEKGWDLGGSGSDLRTPSCCLGPARCEFAMYDTLDVIYELTKYYQDEIHRPAFPYKFKIKASGCPNDCVASIARSDMSIIGTWRDSLTIDQAEIKNYAQSGKDILNDVVMLCPTKCLSYKNDELQVEAENCVRCMHCLNVLPKAIRPGKEQGATILLGAKAPIMEGAMLASVLVPFIKLEAPYDNLKELIESLWEFWDEHGKNKERIGELVERVGKGTFVEAVGLEPIIEMVNAPRENPYIFYDEYYEESKD